MQVPEERGKSSKDSAVFGAAMGSLALDGGERGDKWLSSSSNVWTRNTLCKHRIVFFSNIDTKAQVFLCVGCVYQSNHNTIALCMWLVGIFEHVVGVSAHA